MSALGGHAPESRKCRVRLRRCVGGTGYGLPEEHRPVCTRITQADDVSIKCEVEADGTLIKQELDIGPTLVQPRTMSRSQLPTDEADDVSIKCEVGADGTLIKQELDIGPRLVQPRAMSRSQLPTDEAAPAARRQPPSVKAERTSTPLHYEHPENEETVRDIMSIIEDDDSHDSDSTGTDEPRRQPSEIYPALLLQTAYRRSQYRQLEQAGYRSSDEDEDINEDDEAVQEEMVAGIRPLRSRAASPASSLDDVVMSEVAAASSETVTSSAASLEPVASTSGEPQFLRREKRTAAVLGVSTEIQREESDRGRRRGRSRGQGRSPDRGRRRGRSGYFRDPYVELYASDTEIPNSLKVQIEKHDSDQSESIAKRLMQVLNYLDNCDPNVEEQKNEMDFLVEELDDFKWKPLTDDERLAMPRETFRRESVGPTRRFESGYEAFRAYWDDNILSRIVTETNAYARTISSEGFQREWFDTDPDEILVLFAFWMMLAIIKLPTIKCSFSNNRLMRIGIFKEMMSESRYWNLNRALHFNAVSSSTDDSDALHEIREILDHLNSKFQEFYVPSRDISVNESFLLWEGPLEFRQYIKTKAAKFGIKMYELNEVSTGYSWSFFVHVKDHRINTSPAPPSASFVLRLVRPVLGSGYTLHLDDHFNSPLLARYLKRRQTDCVGTLEPIRRFVPTLNRSAPLKKREFVARQADGVLVVTVHDGKRVTLISTCHSVAQILSEGVGRKPGQGHLRVAHDHDRCMGGVDRVDQTLEPYLIERKRCTKWTKKLFKRLLNLSIQNARVLVERSTESVHEVTLFRMELVEAILDKHLGNVPRRPRNHPGKTPTALPTRMSAQPHLIRRIRVTEEQKSRVKTKHHAGRKRCAWCLRNGRGESRTVYECTTCEIPLCVDPCFYEYHSHSLVSP